MRNIGKTVCKNFNRLVDSSGKTKREIAHSMGVSESTLQRWKSGVSIPEIPNIERLAEVLSIDPHEFFKTEEQSDSSLDLIKGIASLNHKEMELLTDTLKNIEKARAKKSLMKKDA